MIRLIARLVVSLAEFISNPVLWFSKRNWLVRLVLVLLIVPAISVITIAWYQFLYEGSLSQLSRPVLSNEEQIEVRIQNVSEEIQELLSEQHEVVSKALLELLDAQEEYLNNTTSSGVLGVVTDETSEEPRVKVVFIPKELQKIPVYQEPSIASRRLTTIDGGNIYFYTETSQDWYRISIDEKQEGWIQKDYIFEL